MKRLRHRVGLLLSAILLGALATAPAAARPGLFLGTTTSVDNSGLLKPLLARFTQDTGIQVRTIVHGTGAILRLARTGDIDAVLVHSRADEDAFVADGNGAFRRDVMTSRFLIVGPRNDPAAIAGLSDPAAALRKLATRQAVFLSRGDNSGTHTAERRFWRQAGLAPASGGAPWYRETGAGMGATLNTAAELNAYTLTESGSWANFGRRGNLVVLVDNPPAMPNPYGIILVNPARHTHTNAAAARKFIDWLTGAAGQAVIADFAIGDEHPFRPAAGG